MNALLVKLPIPLRFEPWEGKGRIIFREMAGSPAVTIAPGI